MAGPVRMPRTPGGSPSRGRCGEGSESISGTPIATTKAVRPVVPKGEKKDVGRAKSRNWSK